MAQKIYSPEWFKPNRRTINQHLNRQNRLEMRLGLCQVIPPTPVLTGSLAMRRGRYEFLTRAI